MPREKLSSHSGLTPGPFSAVRKDLQESFAKSKDESAKAQSKALEVILVLTEQAGEERRDMRERLGASEERGDKAIEWIEKEEKAREKWGSRGWIFLSGVLVLLVGAMLVTWLVKK